MPPPGTIWLHARAPSLSFMRAAEPQVVDQSSARNKRDNRLAGGHERVAGTVMVLRKVSHHAPFLGQCHCLHLCRAIFVRNFTSSTLANGMRKGGPDGTLLHSGSVGSERAELTGLDFAPPNQATDRFKIWSTAGCN
jgi:hypothetical protein